MVSSEEVFEVYANLMTYGGASEEHISRMERLYHTLRAREQKADDKKVEDAENMIN